MHTQPWCVNICLYFQGRIPRGRGKQGPAYQKSQFCADVGEQRRPPEGCGCILGTPGVCSDSPGAGRALTAWWAEATGGASLFCPWAAWYSGSSQHCADSSRGCESCAIKVLCPTPHPSAVVSCVTRWRPNAREFRKNPSPPCIHQVLNKCEFPFLLGPTGSWRGHLMGEV